MWQCQTTGRFIVSSRLCVVWRCRVLHTCWLVYHQDNAVWGRAHEYKCWRLVYGRKNVFIEKLVSYNIMFLPVTVNSLKWTLVWRMTDFSADIAAWVYLDEKVQCVEETAISPNSLFHMASAIRVPSLLTHSLKFVNEFVDESIITCCHTISLDKMQC